jgi:Pyruvate/2-oxoacid:ferredoxin oxidoreductase gamma subunit
MKSTSLPKTALPKPVTEGEAKNIISATVGVSLVIVLMLGYFTGHLSTQSDYIAAAIVVAVLSGMTLLIRRYQSLGKITNVVLLGAMAAILGYEALSNQWTGQSTFMAIILVLLSASLFVSRAKRQA